MIGELNLSIITQNAKNASYKLASLTEEIKKQVYMTHF